MCGICGIYRFDNGSVDLDILTSMNNTMILRGPDDAGVFMDHQVGMAMRRLSIIDVAGGHQPIFNEDKTIGLVLNGEIYNYIELRQELEMRGHQFQTHSDVEVLVHLYEEKGVEAIQDLNGMFAFCLWDRRRHRLWLGRDRLGIKPLVYFRNSEVLVFGSTLDAVCAHPSVPRQIDEESFLLYLGLAYVPTPRSIYKDIQKLPPGHWMLVEGDSVHVQKYWDFVGVERRPLTRNEFEDSARHILHNSISIHGRSDVPVGCFLSGGIDSSLVTALFSRQSDYPVHSFSIDFTGKEISELPYAALVAEQNRTQHHPYTLDAQASFDILNEVIPRMDEPMSDSAIMPSYYLSQKSREDGIKVVLAGAGGDELFGGYFRHYKYKRDWVVGSLGAIPIRIMGRLGEYLPIGLTHYGVQLADKGISFGMGTSGVHLGLLQKLLRRRGDFDDLLDLFQVQFNELRALEEQLGFSYARMAMDLKQYLPDNILGLTDKTTMAASVEARVPLLDHRLVELVFGVEPDVNIAKHTAKNSLKRLARNILPEQILNRPKAGFNGPVNYWLHGPQREAFCGTLDCFNNAVTERFFDMDRLKSCIRSPDQLMKGSETIFMLFVFNRWFHSRFDHDSHIRHLPNV